MQARANYAAIKRSDRRSMCGKPGAGLGALRWEFCYTPPRRSRYCSVEVPRWLRLRILRIMQCKIGGRCAENRERGSVLCGGNFATLRLADLDTALWRFLDGSGSEF